MKKSAEQMKQEQQQYYMQTQPEAAPEAQPLPEVIPEAAPEAQPLPDLQELSLSDGQPAPDLQAPEMIPEAAPQAKYGIGSILDDNYSRDEFKIAFNEVLLFLHDPKAPSDTFEALAAKGQGIAADKIYNLAAKYKWLNWIINRRTDYLKDTMLLTVFCVQEADIIGKNWFNFSIKEKGQKWFADQAKKRIVKALNPLEWGFLARLGVGKRTKPLN